MAGGPQKVLTQTPHVFFVLIFTSLNSNRSVNMFSYVFILFRSSRLYPYILVAESSGKRSDWQLVPKASFCDFCLVGSSLQFCLSIDLLKHAQRQ